MAKTKTLNENGAPAPLLQRLAIALGDPTMHEALQKSLCPKSREEIEKLLFTAERRVSATHVEAATAEVIPDGLDPYQYLGIDREDFLKSILQIPNALPAHVSRYSPERKLSVQTAIANGHAHFFAVLRSALIKLSTKKEITLYDLVGDQFDGKLSQSDEDGFRNAQMDRIHHVPLGKNVAELTDEDFRGLRTVRGVGFKVLGRMIAFKVLADKTNGFKTIAALAAPLPLDLPPNVVIFARPDTP